MAAAAILDFQNAENFCFGKAQDSRNASLCQILRRSIKPLLRYGHFRFFMAAAAILDFQNVEILGVGILKTTIMRHRAKFRADRRNSCYDMVILLFF